MVTLINRSEILMFFSAHDDSWFDVMTVNVIHPSSPIVNSWLHKHLDMSRMDENRQNFRENLRVLRLVRDCAVSRANRSAELRESRSEPPRSGDAL